ncbi:lipoprotein 17-related variable surface protein [Mycoplasmopsis pulmonis]|uniref:lipoprotein 17-related variable surface protein n=1 Tax=Mycoplasmopsis pulmonis TaxID=2107 RepID=UPI00100501EE|nr:lipoprotein 17-related variable surface protein [Mycoplasmopsis pulmonis]MDZ7293444.1 lipoprotein 17-related variable surface protein [Mycoplasmopsis pulmonis]VEU68469.1 Lipoprotein associated domain [Mycoplasmopsis pulmonis]
MKKKILIYSTFALASLALVGTISGISYGISQLPNESASLVKRANELMFNLKNQSYLNKSIEELINQWQDENKVSNISANDFFNKVFQSKTPLENGEKITYSVLGKDIYFQIVNPSQKTISKSVKITSSKISKDVVMDDKQKRLNDFAKNLRVNFKGSSASEKQSDIWASQFNDKSKLEIKYLDDKNVEKNISENTEFDVELKTENNAFVGGYSNDIAGTKVIEAIVKYKNNSEKYQNIQKIQITNNFKRFDTSDESLKWELSNVKVTEEQSKKSENDASAFSGNSLVSKFNSLKNDDEKIKLLESVFVFDLKTNENTKLSYKYRDIKFNKLETVEGQKGSVKLTYLIGWKVVDGNESNPNRLTSLFRPSSKESTIILTGLKEELSREKLLNSLVDKVELKWTSKDAIDKILASTITSKDFDQSQANKRITIGPKANTDIAKELAKYLTEISVENINDVTGTLYLKVLFKLKDDSTINRTITLVLSGFAKVEATKPDEKWDVEIVKKSSLNQIFVDDFLNTINLYKNNTTLSKELRNKRIRQSIEDYFDIKLLNFTNSKEYDWRLDFDSNEKAIEVKNNDNSSSLVFNFKIVKKNVKVHSDKSSGKIEDIVFDKVFSKEVKNLGNAAEKRFQDFSFSLKDDSQLRQKLPSQITTNELKDQISVNDPKLDIISSNINRDNPMFEYKIIEPKDDKNADDKNGSLKIMVSLSYKNTKFSKVISLTGFKKAAETPSTPSANKEQSGQANQEANSKQN